jgi:cytochrome o ubiquinol oxidase subunit 3
MATTTMAAGTEGESRSYYDTDPHDHPPGGSTMLGFWLYLMSDCLIFAMLFAAWGVYGASTAGGPGPKELFDLKLVAVNTAMLLFSSLTYGLAMISADEGKKRAALGWFAATGLFGAAFLAIELYEFNHLIHEGAGPQRSAFLSSFFTLVGTHGLHVTFGLVWLVVLMVQVARRGLEPANMRRLQCLSLFWHFLDVIWIGVFTFVYLLGVLR